MAPIGYLFILVGAFVLRQVIVGRGKDIPSDARDAANALLSGKPETLGEVMSRRGENVSTVPLDVSSGDSGTVDTSTVLNPFGGLLGGTYAAEVRKLGQAAKGYALGATGPSYYDCSGLLWKAAYLLGIYKGERFTTATFTTIAASWADKVDAPAIGDIVLWANSHMGVCVGSDRMYSARSVAKGIGESSISGDSNYFGRAPTYWRIRGNG